MKRIILHHSLTEDGKVVDFNAICDYHVKVKKWNPPCGYNEVIETVEDYVTHFEGRDRFSTGAHTSGQNVGTIGICIVGNFDIEPPSQKVLDYLYKRLDFYRTLYGSIQIEGHCDHPHPVTGHVKSCPGKLFPLGVIKEHYSNNTHWAEGLYTEYNQNIGTMHEKRFDDPLTRGEYLALRVSEYKKEGK